MMVMMMHRRRKLRAIAACFFSVFAILSLFAQALFHFSLQDSWDFQGGAGVSFLETTEVEAPPHVGSRDVASLPSHYFECSSSVKIPATYVDDNYCDCLRSGADEPSTSACSHVTPGRATFACHDGTEIYASRIGDGVCDCCRGEDEEAGLCKAIC